MHCRWYLEARLNSWLVIKSLSHKMDWTKVNWFPTERTMDITPESLVPHHKPRWYISWNMIPIVFGILNHVLKW